MKKAWIASGLLAVAVAGGAWYVGTNSTQVQTFELVAKPQQVTLQDGATVEAWTYGGTVPGTQIRVTEGDTVRVTLKNELDVPTSIHWHGLPVPNRMDGVPGQTQNAVQPGETFTYEFTADTPGTYWYHSHEKSSTQVDKGLYGTIIIDPKHPSHPTDRDLTLVFDEWSVNGLPNENAHGGSPTTDGTHADHGSTPTTDATHDTHGGTPTTDATHDTHGGTPTIDATHDAHGGTPTTDGTHDTHGGTPTTDATHDVHGNAPTAHGGTPASVSHDDVMRQMYNVFTVNGAAGASIEPLRVQAGERVKLRLVNAGFQTHLLDLHGQPFQITDTDGQPIQHPQELRDQLIPVAPGERYDVVFTAQSSFTIDNHATAPAARTLRIPVLVDDQPPVTETAHATERFDLANYGHAPLPATPTYSASYTLALDNPVNADGVEQFTINGQTHSNIPPITVRHQDTIKLTFTNTGTADHPMHLHGHFFRVLSHNGRPFTNGQLLKDTLNVRPGDTYEVALTADNDGQWMFHCHDLHHAAAGMMTELRYAGAALPPGVDPSHRSE